MLKVLENFSLKKYNTFGIDAVCRFFAELTDAKDIVELMSDGILKSQKRFVLGGGSNLLFRDFFDGVIIHPVNKGIEITEETDDFVIVKVAAGEIWDDFVAWAVDNNYGGVENLSLIPGNVGASPVQNVGAYGVEAKDCIDRVEAFSLDTLKPLSLTNAECRFSYRNSIFKQELKDTCIVLNVYFKLQKKHTFNIGYSSLEATVLNKGTITLQTIRKSIIEIRESKLPDPEKIGNAGSFFKNPIVENKLADMLKQKYPEIVTYTIDEKHTKLAAGWMIDTLGWKGRSVGNAAVHDKQALVLVNKGDASGSDVETLSNEIRQNVFEEFGVKLEPEVIFL